MNQARLLPCDVQRHQEKFRANRLCAFPFPQLLSGEGPFLFFVFLLCCYLPVLLLWMGAIPFSYRFEILILLLAIFCWLGRRRRYSLAELGVSRKHFKVSLYWNLGFSFIGILGLCCASHWQWIPVHSLFPPPPSFYLVYILFLAPIQEVIYRGIFFAEMQRRNISNHWLLILISSMSFAALHLMYHYPPILWFTFISGVCWGILFLKWKNIWSISLSHALLGSVAIHLGFI